jgi:hypothetical protein
MTPQGDAPLEIARARTAWTLHEWNLLLRQLTMSLYAEHYQRAAASVVGALESVETMFELVRVYFSPPPHLKILVLELCVDEEIPLFPHVLLGASCALRLRQLLAPLATSDSG